MAALNLHAIILFSRLPAYARSYEYPVISRYTPCILKKIMRRKQRVYKIAT